MKKKLTLFQSLILIVSLGIVFMAGLLFARSSLLNQAEANVVSLTNAYTTGFNGDLTVLSVREDNVRETIIAEDGKVLWDSKEADVSKMENHANREEVVSALNDAPKTIIRSSATMGVEQLYYAEKKTIDGTIYVVRVSYLTSGLTQFLTGYLPWMIIVTIVALASSVVASALLSSRALEPLKKIEHNLSDVAEGRVPAPIKNEDKDIQTIADNINEVSSSLVKTMAQLKEESSTLQLVLDSGTDAIVAINKENEILFSNKKFNSFFPSGNRYLPEDIKKTFEEKPERITLHDTPYLVRVSENEKLSLLVLTDITSQVNGEQERQEFFDASSHELKTPLTAIKGFNELIGLRSEDPLIKTYSAKVEKETDRMLSVLTDMLRISKLEGEEAEKELPLLNLATVADEIFKELQPLADSRSVTLKCEGEMEEPLTHADAYSLIKNLVENGILYNIKGGHVQVKMEGKTLSVEDDGQGIPEKDQARIFERFYRVDKSRSRENGGTGLGLSIVKHICLKYRAKLFLTSRPGYGSTFTIAFPFQDTEGKKSS
jgi:two-component system phosphate regulon sensor histidine kinase PhoR